MGQAELGLHSEGTGTSHKQKCNMNGFASEKTFFAAELRGWREEKTEAETVPF